MKRSWQLKAQELLCSPRHFVCCATVFLLLLACIFLWRPWTFIGVQEGCSRGCCALIVLVMLLPTDEFNNPVHFTIDSEGDQIASAWAAPADAGWVTSACLWEAGCLGLTAGMLLRSLGDSLVSSSRFGLTQNSSARCDGPAFLSSISKYQIPVLRPSTSWSCWFKLDNPRGWWIVPAHQALSCQQSLWGLLLGGLTALPFLIYFWMSWPKVRCLKLTLGRLSCNEFWCFAVLVKAHTAFHG